MIFTFFKKIKKFIDDGNEILERKKRILEYIEEIESEKVEMVREEKAKDKGKKKKSKKKK